jgi:hypothetical protein
VTVTQLAAALDLDVCDVGIWDEGLAPPLRAALERARCRGIHGAAVAIDDVELHGSGALIVAAVVRRLAADLTMRTREDLRPEGLLEPLI